MSSMHQSTSLQSSLNIINYMILHFLCLGFLIYKTGIVRHVL